MSESKSDKPRYTWTQKRIAILRQLTPYLPRLYTLIVAEIIVSLGNAVVPYVTGKFFDALIKPHTLFVPTLGIYQAWVVLLVTWLVLQLVTNTISYLVDRRQRLMTTQIEAGVSAQSYVRLLTLPIGFHKTHRTGEIQNDVSRAGWQIGGLVNTSLNIAPQFLTILIGVTISFLIYPKLACVLLAGVAVYLLFLIRVLPQTAAYQEEGMKKWSEAAGDAADAYANVSTVKQASAEAYERERILTSFYEKAVPAWYRMERAWSDLNFFQRAVVTLTQGAILLFSVFLVAGGKITIGDLIAFNAYAGMIIGPFVQLGNNWQTIQNGFISAARLERIFGTEPEPYTHPDAVPLADVHGNVMFTDVHFAYSEEQPEVLKGVTFAAHAGEVVAFVGETGVGKSTTADLISAYYFPTTGSVEIDGVDTRNLNLQELRQQIAVVPQEVVLFNASIKDNIRYGRPNATDAEVEAAAKEAFADSFIQKFPEKYEQEVGERGVKLSVGQKQRVAIARAILRSPKILVLDEPTSALDSETESAITTSLERLMHGRTTFIIAHRLSTVRKANRILVLEDGVIAESGTHGELLERNGTYARLYNLHIGLHE